MTKSNRVYLPVQDTIDGLASIGQDHALRYIEDCEKITARGVALAWWLAEQMGTARERADIGPLYLHLARRIIEEPNAVRKALAQEESNG